MKKIELFEKAIAEQAGSLKDYGINGTLFWVYRNSIEAGNDKIDFSDSSLIPTLAEFEKHGFKIAGLTEVNARYTDFKTGEKANIPAIIMKRN